MYKPATISSITIKHSPLDSKSWQLLNPDTPQPLQAHWAYGKAVKIFGAEVHQVIVYMDNKPVALMMPVSRTFLKLIKVTTVFRSPHWLDNDLTEAQKSAILSVFSKEYKKWKWQFLTIIPETPEGDTSTSLMRKAGLGKVMTGFSTAWVDLSGTPDDLRARLKGKWRNQLKKAESEKFDLTTGGKKPSQYDWLLSREQEQRSNRRYQATPLGLVPTYVMSARAGGGDPILTVTAHIRREKIAGALFLIHGNSATYHIGWSGEVGRHLNAQNRVLFQAMCLLQEKGVRWLDLGGMNTAEMSNLTRFKLGLGADPVTLSGAYM